MELEASGWRIEIGLLSVTAEGDASEWEHLMLAALDEAGFGGTGYRKTWRPDLVPARYEIQRSTSPLASRLEVAILTDGSMYAWIYGDGVVPENDQVEPWLNAIAEAKSSIGSSHETFEWSAVVGPKPMFRAIGQSLNREISLGPVRVVPYDKTVLEWRPADRGSLMVRRSFLWRPSFVYGSSTGYNWDSASRDAARVVFRACALLSLVHANAWIAREMAQPTSFAIPEVRAVINAPGGEQPTEEPPEVTTIEPPEWLDGAWRRMDGDPILAGAIEACQQGMEMIDEHPSQAAVAFVAAIETLGVVLEPPTTCAHCGQRLGYAKAFRRALREVRSEAEANELATLYSARSKTAHEGRVHGFEQAFGAMVGFSHWAPTPAYEFEWRQLTRLSSACRDILIARLSS